MTWGVVLVWVWVKVWAEVRAKVCVPAEVRVKTGSQRTDPELKPASVEVQGPGGGCGEDEFPGGPYKMS